MGRDGYKTRRQKAKSAVTSQPWKKQKIKGKGAIEQHKELKVGFLNLDGLSEQTFIDVKRTIEAKKLDVVGFVETKRRLKDVPRDISIEGFNMIEVVRSDAAYDKNGGGIVLYSRITKGLRVDRLSPRISQDENTFVDKERLWILVSSESSKTAICMAYFGCFYSDHRHDNWNQKMYQVIQAEVIDFENKGYRVLIMAAGLSLRA